MWEKFIIKNVKSQRNVIMSHIMPQVKLKQFETILFPQDMIQDIHKLHWNIIPIWLLVHHGKYTIFM